MSKFTLSGALKSAGATEEDLAVLLREAGWDDNFGGDLWDKALAYVRQNRAVVESGDLRKVLVVVDRIYDMEHNSGSILNKGQWDVGKFLDHRAEMKTGLELVRYASERVRGLVGSAKVYGGEAPSDTFEREVVPYLERELIQLSEMLARNEKYSDRLARRRAGKFTAAEAYKKEASSIAFDCMIFGVLGRDWHVYVYLDRRTVWLSYGNVEYGDSKGSVHLREPSLEQVKGAFVKWKREFIEALDSAVKRYGRT